MPEVQAEVRIHIKPEDVNETLAKAVMASQIGPRVVEAVSEFVKKNNGHGLLEKAVQDYLANSVSETLKQEPYASQIGQAIKACLAEKLPSLVSAIVEKGLRGY